MRERERERERVCLDQVQKRIDYKKIKLIELIHFTVERFWMKLKNSKISGKKFKSDLQCRRRKKSNWSFFWPIKNDLIAANSFLSHESILWTVHKLVFRSLRLHVFFKATWAVNFNPLTLVFTFKYQVPRQAWADWIWQQLFLQMSSKYKLVNRS